MKSFAVAIAVLLAFASAATAGVPGPIKVSPDGRYFVDRTGAPFFWLEWGDLVPDQRVFATGVGSERTLHAAMRAKDGSRVP